MALGPVNSLIHIKMGQVSLQLGIYKSYLCFTLNKTESYFEILKNLVYYILIFIVHYRYILNSKFLLNLFGAISFYKFSFY